MKTKGPPSVIPSRPHDATANHFEKPRPKTLRFMESGQIGLALAAQILGRKRPQIEKLVREDHVVPASGKSGKGGGFHVDFDNLVLLDTAARLSDLRVPIVSVKRLSTTLSDMAKQNPDETLTVVYSPEHESVISLPDPGKLDVLLRHGATILGVDIKQRRAELYERLKESKPPRQRGRPKLDREWVAKKFEASSGLGSDDATPEEFARLMGDD